MSTAPGKGSSSPARWREHRSAHFVFWFMAGSRVANSVTALASRLEAIREATVKAFGLEDLPAEQVEVYLSEMPNGRHSRKKQGDGRGHEVGSGQTLTVCLSDAPGESLEFAFMELLLTSSLGMRADGSAMLRTAFEREVEARRQANLAALREIV